MPLAYGFVGLDHVMSQRVTQVGVGVINDAIRQTYEEYNRQSQALLTAITRRTVLAKEKYYLSGSGTLQPLDEWGNPLPVKDAGSYDVAYPIQGGGTAWGDNRVSRALMTVEEANNFTVEALRKDADWLMRHALAALFTNTTWTYDDKLLGNLTIQPLANNDAVTYLRRGGAVATDDHYAAQAAAIADAANPFAAIYDELTEHIGNGNTVVSYIPTNLKTSVSGLAEFVSVPDQNINPGANTATLTNNGAAALRMGDSVLGYLRSSKVWIVEWKRLPDSYIVSLAPDAEDVALAMREYDSTELQGFFPEFHSPDGNVQVRRSIRYAGFGARNRVAAHVQRIGNAAYAIPTGYSAPLGV